MTLYYNINIILLGFLSDFQFSNCFVTLLMSLVGCLLFKIFVKFSELFPCLVDFITAILEGLVRQVLCLEGAK